MIKHIYTGLVSAGLCTGAFGAVTFNFNYTDAGVGFNDPATGAARRAALEQAASEVASIFGNYSATIQLDVNGSVADGSTLAAAGSNNNSPAPAPGFNSRGDVMVKILGGADPAPGIADGSVTWNFSDFQWELGSDFQAGEFDFLSTAKHELLHAVGFLSDIGQNGQDAYSTPPGNPGIWSPFDQFVNSNAGAVINPTTFSLDITRWNAAYQGGAGASGLSFNGPNAMAANGGNPIYLYTPAAWEDGSSGSHIDDQFYSGTYMMEAATNPGLSNRDISAVEIGFLRDIGYTLVIPEPASSILILLPLAMFLGRRRR